VHGAKCISDFCHCCVESKRGRIRREVTDKEAIQIIRRTIPVLQEQGGGTIQAESLQLLLNRLDSGEVDRDIALLVAAQKERATAKYGARVNFQVELFKSVIQSGHAALKYLFLLNGGAGVAVLALIGHLSTSAIAAAQVNKFACPLLSFAVGLTFAATGSGLTYLVQRAFSSRKRRLGRRLNNVTVLLSAGSIIAFGIGSALAYFAIQAMAASQSIN
jgi:hypothetical protein